MGGEGEEGGNTNNSKGKNRIFIFYLSSAIFTVSASSFVPAQFSNAM